MVRKLSLKGVIPDSVDEFNSLRSTVKYNNQKDYDTYLRLTGNNQISDPKKFGLILKIKTSIHLTVCAIMCVMKMMAISQMLLLTMDASNEGIGTVLSQKIGNEECVITYFSKSLGKPERNYCVTRKELLAIVKSIEHFHHYFYGRKFLFRTDHVSLRWLSNFREPEGQIACWIQRLQEYDFEIQHRRGTSHVNADALSRRPCKESCKHCTNAEKKFGMEKDISVKVLTTEDAWSSSEVQKAQPEDPAIRPIVEKKLNSEDRPSWQEIAPENPATQRYWALWDSLHLKDGVLYLKWKRDDGSFCRWQLILPKSRIQEVLRETHDSASVGHFEVMKTLGKTRERFYWDRLRADVEK
ncbi:Transposon Ty3-G Gag-Pol polyprotein [Araneus ventricosus]|uniref:RNA-directed DNA polymerase n=1 Tax=Araneus ventricosus TaxID=182803 RepID=A0A4Y2N541_ARAVE|nr:Transposon Ty3-G Gag-Pol polyprotein [Araneus ventricosus]